MNIRHVIGALLIILTVVPTIFLVHTLSSAPCDTFDVSGKTVFNTTNEYIQFKQALANPLITINSITVLSSDPPIIVLYNITRPADTPFPYDGNEFGNKTVNDPLMNGLLFAAVISLCTGIGLLFFP